MMQHSKRSYVIVKTLAASLDEDRKRGGLVGLSVHHSSCSGDF